MTISKTKNSAKISICVVTYNQEKYIRQCLQSIVDQKTNFDFEVIVSDDCSTDSTKEIVQEFKNKYPNIVKPIFHEKNIGAFKNFVDTHNQANGEYICHCDGDDYWLPGKLQAQADFLDNHPNCNIVWHRMKILNDKTGQILDDYLGNSFFCKERFSRSDLLRFGSLAYHSSKMYRNKCDSIYHYVSPVLDYYMNIIQIGDGFACILDNIYGVYRINEGGISIGGKMKYLYVNNLKQLLEKYPEHKLEIAENALLVAIVDAKNFRRSWFSAFKIFLKASSFKPFKPFIRLAKSIHLRFALRQRKFK